jgi:hypothetical protein
MFTHMCKLPLTDIAIKSQAQFPCTSKHVSQCAFNHIEKQWQIRTTIFETATPCIFVCCKKLCKLLLKKSETSFLLWRQQHQLWQLWPCTNLLKLWVFFFDNTQGKLECLFVTRLCNLVQYLWPGTNIPIGKKLYNFDLVLVLFVTDGGAK